MCYVQYVSACIKSRLSAPPPGLVSNYDLKGKLWRRRRKLNVFVLVHVQHYLLKWEKPTTISGRFLIQFFPKKKNVVTSSLLALRMENSIFNNFYTTVKVCLTVFRSPWMGILNIHTRASTSIASQNVCCVCNVRACDKTKNSHKFMFKFSKYRKLMFNSQGAVQQNV